VRSRNVNLSGDGGGASVATIVVAGLEGQNPPELGGRGLCHFSAILEVEVPRQRIVLHCGRRHDCRGETLDHLGDLDLVAEARPLNTAVEGHQTPTLKGPAAKPGNDQDDRASLIVLREHHKTLVLLLTVLGEESTSLFQGNTGILQSVFWLEVPWQTA